MKRSYFSRLASIAIVVAMIWGCTSPTSSKSSGDSTSDAAPGSGSVGGTDGAKIAFEGTTASIAGSSGYVYSPKLALTTVDTGIAATQATDYFYAGASSVKLVGTLQQDKYDYSSGTTLNSPPKTIEMGLRVKLPAGSGSSSTSFDLTDKIVSLAVYIPVGGANTSFQIALQDTASQQAISAAVTVSAGKWHVLYFKADSSTLNSSGKPLLTTVDSDKAFVAKGVYTSGTFDVTKVSEIELRSLGDVTKTAVDAAATVYVDSLSWTDTAYATAAATPTFSVAAGTYDTVQTVTLASTSTGATIHYTVDGTAPTSSSPTYSSAITVDKSLTLKAYSVVAGIADSAVASAAYVLQPTITTGLTATPTTAYSTDQTATFTATGGATLTYNITSSTDGSTPADPADPAVSGTTYPTGGINLAAPASAGTNKYTIWVTATKTGWTAATITKLTYTVSTLPQATAPTVSNGATAGIYSTSASVALTSAQGLDIYYTTDGTTPTSSNGQKYSSAISIGSNVTLKAVAVGNGSTYVDSTVASWLYLVDPSYTGATANIGFVAGTPSDPVAGLLSNTGIVAPATTSPYWFVANGGVVATTPAPTAVLVTGATNSVAAVKITDTLKAFTGGNWGADTAMSTSLLKFGVVATDTGAYAAVPGTTNVAANATSTYTSATVGTSELQVVDNSGKTLAWTVSVYIPTGSPINRFGLVLYDKGTGGARFPMEPVSAGWNKITWNIQGIATATSTTIAAPSGSPSPNPRAMMCTGGTVQNATTGVTGTFQAGGVSGIAISDASLITRAEFLASTTVASAAGTAVTYYIDSFTWQ